MPKLGSMFPPCKSHLVCVAPLLMVGTEVAVIKEAVSGSRLKSNTTEQLVSQAQTITNYSMSQQKNASVIHCQDTALVLFVSKQALKSLGTAKVFNHLVIMDQFDIYLFA